MSAYHRRAASSRGFTKWRPSSTSIRRGVCGFINSIRSIMTRRFIRFIEPWMRPIRAAAAMTILLLAGSLPAAPSPRYVRSIAHVTPPEVTLVDERGEQVPLAAVLESSEPVLLQFIFTTCPSVCPALSATFSAAQEELGAGARLVSISIDPEFDTPARLREYARRFNAGPRWRFLTGSRENVAAVQKAF